MIDNKEEKEIDLLELARKLWDNKKFIIKVTLIGAIVGLIIAFSIPKEYTSTVVFTTKSNDAKTGNMGALASLAGINFSNMGASDAFSPELYPNIVSSTPFIQGLYDINVSDKNLGVDTTLYGYLSDKQKKAWWTYVMDMPNAFLKSFKGKNEELVSAENNNYLISDEEMNVIEKLRSSFEISTEKKTGITKLETKMQSPIIAAFLADTLTSYLQSYIIEERTKKAKADFTNTQRLYNQAKNDYYFAQQNLTSFIDANKNLISARYRLNQEKLQNEVAISYSVYTQMAQQLQVDKIRVQDYTPVFTILQPAIQSIYPSGPSKKMILIAVAFLAALTSCVFILRKDLLNIIKS
ncbi:Wzz/FepE/Etk N-terminal domain-containing protein [Dysgonomonas sp. Marseille-P4361]|uniref:Wzz/FepE/Etk N-terminal domain-containing protein n=1 Tax=Dysgonomonas sp. Marseille-P4361 TaxID=2161820 RepID=UPI000D54C070|nr:Wzz/FepE/Etk N-terminal domain-containing protein [Dysgonomonas sp. Marseille-P4361]